jgi:hypothetical protein
VNPASQEPDIGKRARWPGPTGLWLIGLSLLVVLAAAWWWSVRSADTAALAPQIQGLVQRCGFQMLKDTCRVMTSAPARASGQPATRLFVAGVGEVDAKVFDDLRRQGDAMCQTVGAQCRQDWHGAPCRVAQALYPAVTLQTQRAAARP